MSTNFDIKAFKRISPNLHKDSLHKVDHSNGDYIITETYEELGETDIKVNISKAINLSLQEDRYIIFRYGKEGSKEEKSCFESIKGNDLRSMKCDITLLIFDKEDEEILLVCGEVKRTLKESNFADARQQLISSYIDLNIFNALMAFNYYPVKAYFFIAYTKLKILRSTARSTSAPLFRSDSKKFIPYNLVREEYDRKKIFYSLDDLHYIKNTIEKDVTILDRENFMNANLAFIKGIVS